jgi:DNA-binding NtrC family response regulator
MDPEPIEPKLRLLVVDDDAVIRRNAVKYFRSLGWHVIEARSGEAAKALFSADRFIDVVISDVQMSAKQDGVELARWLSTNYPEVIMILTSGAARLADIPSSVCPQASTFFKPYRFSMVAARIEALRH